MSLTAEEFLAALVGQPVEIQIDGLGTVRARGLTQLEYERIASETGKSDVLTMHRTIQAGLVEPALTMEQLAQIGLHKTGVIKPLFFKILSLSADNEEDKKEAASFGGGGS
jgi:hypothetical protein